MAGISNRDRVGRAFERLADGLEPYVDRRMKRFHPAKDGWFDQWLAGAPNGISSEAHLQDPQVLLRVMKDFWSQAFRQELSLQVRNAVYALGDRRNRWAHNKPFQFDDTYRVLDELSTLPRPTRSAGRRPST